MAGPWEDFQRTAAPSGPWSDFAAPGVITPAGRRAQDLGDAILAGLQNSATGLAVRGKLPSQQLGEDAPWYHRLAAGASGIVADLPLSVVGAIGGSAAGTAVAPGPGTLVGGGAGAFAAPMALRDALVEAYSHNHALSWEGVWEIAKAALKGGTKGAVIGGATAGAGRFVAPLVTKAGGSQAAATVASTGAELATLTATSATLEGHMPTWQDFMDNALLLGGMKAAVGTAIKLRSIYAETGRRPDEVLADAQRDPKLKAEITGASETAVLDARISELKREYAFQERSGTGSTRHLREQIEALESQRKDWWHGSPREFERFDIAAPSTTLGGLRSYGVSLAPEKTTAERYAKDFSQDRTGFVYSVGARVEKSLSLSAAEFESLQSLVGKIDGKQAVTETQVVGLEVMLAKHGVRLAEGQHPIEAIKTAGFDSIAKAAGRGGAEAELLVFDPSRLTIRTRNGQTVRSVSVPSAYAPLALEQRIAAAIDADPRPDMIRRNLTNDGSPPRLGEPPIADPVKYEYITDKDTAKGVLRIVTDMYSTEMQAQTRGVVPNTATAIEGLKLVHSGKLGEHIVGEAGNAAEIYARAHLLKGATNHAVAELAKLASTPEAELTPAAKLTALAALERVSMLKAELEGVGAEAGRALQIFRAIKRDPAFLGEAESLLNLAERKGALQDIARLVATLKDPARASEFMRRYTEATTVEKVMEAWKAAILSGPMTHLANIAGNLTKWAVEIPENVIAASLTAAHQAAKGDPLSLAQWKARALSPFYGLQHGAREALTVAAEVWQGQGAHLEKADVYRTAISGKKGEVIRIPFKALQVEDALFRTVAERAEAHKMAVDRVTKEGLHPETAEGRARVAQLTAHPELGLSEKAGLEAIARVQEAGAEAVFAQRLGPRMEIAQRAMAGSALGFVIPFVRTPANLVSWALQHTPGLNLVSGRWRADWAAGGERQARAAARVLIGTGLAMTAFQLAQDGALTGAGMFDKQERGTKTAAGWQPYSVKIGDKFYSYQRIEPVAKVLGLAADLVELMQNTKDDTDAAKIASMLVLMFGNATVSTTYLSGLSGAINAITDPDRYGERFMEQYATSVVPKIVGQSVTLADEHKREVEGVLDAIQSQLPFLREKLLPKRDVWGEPQKNDRWFAVMPVATSEASQEKVRTEAVRLHIAIADAPRFVTERAPFNPKDKRVELAPEQRDVFREVSGKNAMALLTPIVNSPDWERIPDFAKAAVYKHVIEGAHKQAQYAALPPDAAERQKLREKIVDRIIKETQQVQ